MVKQEFTKCFSKKIKICLKKNIAWHKIHMHNANAEITTRIMLLQYLGWLGTN